MIYQESDVITRRTIWKTHDRRQIPLNELEDTHLANILHWIWKHPDIYPIELLRVLQDMALDRGLSQAFLDRAEIPWKNADGKWCLNCAVLEPDEPQYTEATQV